MERLLDWCASAGAAAIPYGGGTSVVGGVEPPRGRVRGRRVDRPARARPGAGGRPGLARGAHPGRRLAGARGAAAPSTASRCATSRSRSSSRRSAAGSPPARAATSPRSTPTSTTWWSRCARSPPAATGESRRLPGSGAGPSPDRMLLGSEGILGVITQAWMRVQARPLYKAGASVLFDAFEAGAEAVRALAQSGLWPSNCRLLDAGEAGLTGAPRRGQALLVLGFESADHPLDAWMARALECCADHGGEAQQVAQARVGAARGGRVPAGAVPARHPDRRRRAQRDVRDGDHLGPPAGVRRARAGGSRGCGGRGVRRGPGYLPPHARLPRRRRRPTSPCSPRRGAAPSSSSGTRSRRRPARRSRARAARSPTTTPSAATTGPGTTASAPEPFAAALRAAKRELDPAAIMNPGVLIDP